MNGKLARLAQQEANLSSRSTSDVTSCDTSTVSVEHCQTECSRSEKKKKKKRLKKSGTEES